ncbi:MAG: hypothetical protein AB1798_16355 [Spirochaetota bacterium]
MIEYVINATGVWKGIGFWDHALTCAGEKNNIKISHKDREVLKKLAVRVAELAARPQESEKVKLWYSHNALQTKHPVILADPENGWNDIITANRMECEGDLARRWEVVLRKEIFWGESMQDDRPIEAHFYIGHTCSDSGWGVSGKFRGGKNGGTYAWDSPVKEMEDLEKLHYPRIEVDYKTTGETINLAKEIFGNILKVKLKGVWWWGFGLTYDLAILIGLERIMLLPYDSPDFLHKAMEILRDGNMQKLNFLEENGLLTLNNDGSYVGSGGIGYTRELPRRKFPDSDSSVRTEDMWGFAESQETIGMSPGMYEEYIFRYQLPILKRFGLNCYGCCEPLDKRWPVIKNIPNLRRVSVSAWADKKKMAEYLQDKYIFSLKPNPADLAVTEMDCNRIQKDMRRYLEITKDAVLEIIMKDNHTLGKNPSNITNWVKIVRQEVEKTGR